MVPPNDMTCVGFRSQLILIPSCTNEMSLLKLAAYFYFADHNNCKHSSAWY